MLYLFSFLFLAIGLVIGWMGAERYIAFVTHERHDFEDLFEENPHPEIYQNGKIYRGDYTAISFEPGFDPESFDPETDIIVDED